jgi:hypothetical protein
MKIENREMVGETNLTKVWARQGLTMNVAFWFQMVNNIFIEIILDKRNKVKGFPTCISRLKRSYKESDSVTMLLQP